MCKIWSNRIVTIGMGTKRNFHYICITMENRNWNSAGLFLCSAPVKWWWWVWVTTVRWRYDAVKFKPYPQKRHPIARPWGRSMGCLSWVQRLNKYCPNSSSIVYDIMIRQRCSGTRLYNHPKPQRMFHNQSSKKQTANECIFYRICLLHKLLVKLASMYSTKPCTNTWRSITTASPVKYV